MKWFVLLGFGLSASAFGINALAENDIAGARAMYERAMRAREKGLWDIACPSFAESYRLYPIAGTMFELADCEQNAGKSSSAFNHYHQYLLEVELLSREKAATHADRVKKSEDAIAKLRDEIPTLTVVMPADAPTDVVVLRDAITLAPASFGVAMPVDPGKHVVKVVSADKQILFQSTIESKPRKPETIEIELPQKPPSPTPTPPEPTTKLEPISPPAHRASLLQTGGYVGLGVGLAGLTTSTVFAGLAMANQSYTDKACSKNEECSASVQGAIEQGRAFGGFSTITFGVGAAGLATGTVLLVLDHLQRNKNEPKTHRPSAGFNVGPSGASLTVSGVF